MAVRNRPTEDCPVLEATDGAYGHGSSNPRGHPQGAVVPDDVIEHWEQAAVVQASMLTLPPERRQVLVDKYVEELSVAQIAATTGKSSKAVESLLFRAREQFRALLHWYFSDFVPCRGFT